MMYKGNLKEKLGWQLFKKRFRLLLKSILHYVVSLLCIGFLSQRKYNIKATQIVLPVLHSDFVSYLSNFGFLSKDYENIISKCDHHIIEK